MTANATLLIDIERPDAAASVSLMCGRDFTVLRTDSTGRDVYGLAHNDREYLFFPMEISMKEEGCLLLGIPAGYEGEILDSLVDGARIEFSSVRGVPYFAGMPEEYQSSSGIIRVDESGALHVHLDKLEPGAPVPLPQEVQDDMAADACGCGGHQHGIASSPDHECCGRHGHHQQGLSDDKVFLDVYLKDLPDAKLASLIRKEASELNALLAIAKRAGLLAEITLEPDGGEDGALKIAVNRIVKTL